MCMHHPSARGTASVIFLVDLFSSTQQDDMSPQVGKQYRTIPPLAKGRGQFCSAKIKEDDNRFVSHNTCYNMLF